jgi:mRNA turnover protein 4
MAKALGLTPADEYRDGISKLVPHLHGNVGLFLTSHPPAEIISFFNVYSATDYPRSGAVSPISFTIPAGIIYSDGEADGAARGIEPLAHSLETTIRSLNVPTRLVKGKVTLDQEYVVCREGQVLDSRQTRLLKLFGKEVAEFKIRLIAYWSAADGSVTEIEEESTEEMKE